jgi:RNA polymerase sigma factor for flagellar operon FliA
MNNRPDLQLVQGQRTRSGHVGVPEGGQGKRLRLVTSRDSSPTATPDGANRGSAHEAAFVSNLALIDSIVRFVCRRQRLSESDADDFGSEVRMRLVDNDYEVFRRFQERSSLRTYLTIVIQRIYLDYRNHQWGKWRPSAEARRLGPIAVRLENLLVRDGLPFGEACEVLRTNEGVLATESDLVAIAVRLPRRTRRLVVGEEQLDGVAGLGDVEDGVVSRERRDAARRVIAALERATETLEDQDRLILRLKFQEGLGVADVARALHLEQRPLYRRLNALLQRLRTALEEAGIDRLEANAIINREDVDISLALLAPAGAGEGGLRRPSSA